MRLAHFSVRNSYYHPAAGVALRPRRPLDGRCRTVSIEIIPPWRNLRRKSQLPTQLSTEPPAPAVRKAIDFCSEAWILAKETVLSFIDDDALSRGAAIAFYTATSLAPVLLIVIAIAGLVFGRDAAQHEITTELSGLMGHQTAEILQGAIAGAVGKSSGIIATIIGIVTLSVTASGVFVEIQSALNAIWRADPKGTTVSRLIQARAASLGLVAIMGFLLMVSLVVSAALTAFGNELNNILPFGRVILSILNVVISLGLISILFAAVYKVLPDKEIEWRDVIIGAVVTAMLFTVGKSIIGLYIGSSSIASSYGAAGGLIVLLLWVYYSVQIFLVGAEFTKVYADRHGSKQGSPR